MKKLMLAVLIVSSLLFISCASTPAKVTQNVSWLDSKAGGPDASMNITGTWTDALNSSDSFMSWGQGELTQEGNNVTGNISTYVIKGIVTGKTIYLVLYNGNKVDYTARLEPKGDNEIYGNYYKAYDKDQTKPIPMSFRKIK
jgi:hypothetical protein